ncbi:MAG: transglycosylase domain-containing protein, partial [Elusimicrobia bacterium]|nr:transglycosylase domain-containing protein [Elusimicrobiota bacterium]
VKSARRRSSLPLLLWVVEVTPLLFLLVILYQYWTVPNVNGLRNRNPETTAFMESNGRGSLKAGKRPKRSQIWVAYVDIPNLVKDAVLVAEDINFFYHEGVDPDEIRESLKVDFQKRRWARGGSTITMQLAKNLYLSPSKNLFRKIKEYMIARRLERDLSKERIFEIYLNVIEWGDGVYGIEAASQHYFAKSCVELFPEEGAFLAAMIAHPYLKSYKRIGWKIQLILKRMLNYQMISGGEYEAALRPGTRLEDFNIALSPDTEMSEPDLDKESQSLEKMAEESSPDNSAEPG